MQPRHDTSGEALHHARRFAGPFSAESAPREQSYALAYRRWLRAHKVLGLVVALYLMLMLVGLGQNGRLADMPDVDTGFWSVIALLPFVPALLFAVAALMARPLGLAVLGLHLIMLVLFAAFSALGLFLWATVFVPM